MWYLFLDHFLLPQDLKRVNSYLKSCFLIFPNYNLGHGLMEMAYNEYINEYYAKIGTNALSFHTGSSGGSGEDPTMLSQQILFLLRRKHFYVSRWKQVLLPHVRAMLTAPTAVFVTGQFDKMKSPFEWDIVTRGLVAMTIEGFVGFLITILCQYNFLRKPP